MGKQLKHRTVEQDRETIGEYDPLASVQFEEVRTRYLLRSALRCGALPPPESPRSNQRVENRPRFICGLDRRCDLAYDAGSCYVTLDMPEALLQIFVALLAQGGYER